MRSCAWGTDTFGLFDHLAAYNMKHFEWMCLVFPQKRQTHKGLSCSLSLGIVGFLGIDSLRSTLVFLGGVTSIGLIISLLGGSEEETKFVEWVLDTNMLSAKPRPILSKGDF